MDVTWWRASSTTLALAACRGPVMLVRRHMGIYYSDSHTNGPKFYLTKKAIVRSFIFIAVKLVLRFNGRSHYKPHAVKDGRSSIPDR